MRISEVWEMLRQENSIPPNKVYGMQHIISGSKFTGRNKGILREYKFVKRAEALVRFAESK